MTSAPPVPPPSYWPDQGTDRPSSPRMPGWAKAILGGTAAVALLGGGLIAVRNINTTPSPPLAEPTFGLPSGLPSLKPSSVPSSDSPSESATPQPSSTFPALKAVPEVCDLLPDALTKRLAPKSVSEVGVAKDGYGALRKGCDWTQAALNIRNGANESRSIYVKVNVWPSVADAREDADNMFDSMNDMGGTKEDNPGLRFLSTYGEVKQLAGIGDAAQAMYTENLKGTTNVWAFVVMGNATIDLRYHGTDNLNKDILAEGDQTRPVPEDVLMRGAEEIAKELVKNLQG
ncbi:hypothetical protein ACIBG8_34095 [Nonomuraea sp. NPDC050556]|uniref:hypothetical protein n=1 Tax=Nonomuraea sp. NPDC050556 TaxID=3364369 RepID=UPI0037B8962C